MSDPIAAAARKMLGAGFDTLRRVVDGLPAEALNWRPAGEETNSIAVQATHAMSATRLLLAAAAGVPAPPRDRAGEFAAVAEGPEPLLRLIDELAAECHAILDGAAGLDWGTLRRRKRDGGAVIELTAAEALFHAVDHLRGHADEAALTRHLWLAGAGGAGSGRAQGGGAEAGCCGGGGG